MTDEVTNGRTANAWLMVDIDPKRTTFPYPEFVVELDGERTSYSAIAEGDWVLVCRATGKVDRVARVMRVRSDLTRTTLYFDRLAALTAGVSLEDLSITAPVTG